MDCQFCVNGVQGTMLLTAGTDSCFEVGEWAVCDRHWPALNQALTFAYDGCIPAHQYAVGLLTDIAASIEEEWVRDQPGEYTVTNLAAYLEPTSVSCEDCGRKCVSVKEAVRCEQKHEQKGLAAATQAGLDDGRDRKHQQMLNEMAMRAPVTGSGGWVKPSPPYMPCMICGRIIPRRTPGRCVECVTAQAQADLDAMETRMGAVKTKRDKWRRIGEKLKNAR